jgi:hypothetical protein
MPYNQRPAELPLVIEECRTALWRCRGNVTKAAEMLKIPSKRLRDFVKKSAYLSAEVQEATEQLVDLAQDVVYEALIDTEDKGRQDSMAKFVLTGPGKARGFGTGAPTINVKSSGGGTVIVGWQDGTMFNPEPQAAKVIDHE